METDTFQFIEAVKINLDKSIYLEAHEKEVSVASI